MNKKINMDGAKYTLEHPIVNITPRETEFCIVNNTDKTLQIEFTQKFRAVVNSGENKICLIGDVDNLSMQIRDKND